MILLTLDTNGSQAPTATNHSTLKHPFNLFFLTILANQVPLTFLILFSFNPIKIPILRRLFRASSSLTFRFLTLIISRIVLHLIVPITMPKRAVLLITPSDFAVFALIKVRVIVNLQLRVRKTAAFAHRTEFIRPVRAPFIRIMH
jgi:hypothetical protein